MSSLFASTRNTRILRGGTLEPLRYIRSDFPERLSEDEIRWLIDHNVFTIVDLRLPQEVAAKPCPLSERPEFTYRNIPVTCEYSVLATPADVVPSYLKMVDGTMDRIIETIESAATNVLYFCAVGKDRTGVVSALLLLRAGATREVIVDDYAASADNLRELLEEIVRQHTELDIHVLTPKAAYMEEFLDRVMG